MTHLDTSFLVDLLRETARGEEGPATAALEEFGSALVTRNAREFERIPGLRVVGY